MLGVWNKDHGFKIIDVPGIGSVSKATIAGDYLFVCGESSDLQKDALVVLSLENGFWNER